MVSLHTMLWPWFYFLDKICLQWRINNHYVTTLLLTSRSFSKGHYIIITIIIRVHCPGHNCSSCNNNLLSIILLLYIKLCTVKKTSLLLFSRWNESFPQYWTYKERHLKMISIVDNLTWESCGRKSLQKKNVYFILDFVFVNLFCPIKKRHQWF